MMVSAIAGSKVATLAIPSAIATASRSIVMAHRDDLVFVFSLSLSDFFNPLVSHARSSPVSLIFHE